MKTRGPFQGVGQIFAYNWPFYLVGASLVGMGVVVLLLVPFPAQLAFCGWAGVGLAIWWLTASLIASWWAYDASPLCRWEWVSDILPTPPRRWVNLHAGLDESTPTLRRLFPGTHGIAMDFYDADTMTEPSIRRARMLTPPLELPLSVKANALSLQAGEIDTAFLFFAAHELRQSAERESLFREVARVLRPGGHVILAEHLRDSANFVAFGPGFLHFWPRSEWQRLARVSGLHIVVERRITPFVAVFVLEKREWSI